MNSFKGELYTLYKSFSFAVKGFKYAVDNERNMRIHLVVAFFVLQFSFIFGIQKLEYIILFMLFGAVITAEMINTSIEALVDLQTSSYAPLAKVAKDVAAGAVLVIALASVIVGCIIFFDFTKLANAFVYMYQKPYLIAIAVVELILGCAFVFKWNKTKIFKLK